MGLAAYLDKKIQMLKNMPNQKLFIYLTVFGIILRFLIPYVFAFLPFNETDPKSWKVSGETVLEGENPYVISEGERVHMKWNHPALIYLFSAVLVIIERTTKFPFMFSIFTILLMSDILTLLTLKRLLQLYEKNTLLAHAYFLNPLTLLAFWYLQLDLIVALTIALFLYYFKQNKMKEAALAISFGAAIKIFPALFALIFLTRKIVLSEKVKLLLLTISVPVLVTLPYFLLTPGTVINELFFTYTRDIYYNRVSLLNTLIIFKSPGSSRERAPEGILNTFDQLLSPLMYGAIIATCYLTRKRPVEQQVSLIVLWIYVLFRDLELHHLVYIVPALVVVYAFTENEKSKENFKRLFILLSILGYACYLVHYKLYRPDIISHEEIFAFIVLITWITNVTLLTSIYRISTEEQYTIKNTEVERKSTH